jgi:hypothetical protein
LAKAKKGPVMTAEEYELLGITAENILYVWSWGFGVVLFSWSMGFTIGLGLSAIKKA